MSLSFNSGTVSYHSRSLGGFYLGSSLFILYVRPHRFQIPNVPGDLSTIYTAYVQCMLPLRRIYHIFLKRRYMRIMLLNTVFDYVWDIKNWDK